MNKSFKNLCSEQQAIAVQRFPDAACGDGFIYQDYCEPLKKPTGTVFCRQCKGQASIDNTVDIELSEDFFSSHISLVENSFNQDASWNGCLFETYGDEFYFVLKQPRQYIWTLVECDQSDSLILLSGFHRVNRMGYLITKKPLPASKPPHPFNQYIVNSR